MKDRAALIAIGMVGALLAWVSWHYAGESVTASWMAIFLVAYAVDNFQLRRQVRSLLADKEKRDRLDKRDALRRLLRGLLAARQKRTSIDR